MPPIVAIRDLARFVGEQVTLQGWVTHRRSKGRIAFLVVRDGSGNCQAVASVQDVSADQFEQLARLTHESAVRLTGVVREDERAPGGFELQLAGVETVQLAEEYPIGRKEHGIEFLLDHRHLWLRHKGPWAVMRIRDEIVKACRDFMYERDFLLIDSPILTPAACEGTSTLFETDYFGAPAYLSQSGQLYVEPACIAHGKVYCFGPTFRAEKSDTRRHLTEFWMIEPEIAWAGLDEIMALAEQMISHIVARVLERRSEELAILERDTTKLESVTPPFPRLSYDDVAERLTRPDIVARAQQAGAPPFQPGSDLGALDETILGEMFDRPLIIHRYPTAVKAFYMEPDPERPDRALCMDIIAPEGYGEIIGGSQRIHDHELLARRIDENGLPEQAFRWYLDIRRFGTVPHAGFGMGIERLVAWISGARHTREAIPYPRTLRRLYP
ncbi:MAG: asparagine--tRNA ligase [Acidobacteriota bacterium]|nr:MAG: asparagine--tRNA ligase [Acidobacteriota bacterium]